MWIDFGVEVYTTFLYSDLVTGTLPPLQQVMFMVKLGGFDLF